MKTLETDLTEKSSSVNENKWVSVKEQERKKQLSERFEEWKVMMLWEMTEGINFNEFMDIDKEPYIKNTKEDGEDIKQSKGKLLAYEWDADFQLECLKVMSVNKKSWGGKYEEWSYKLNQDPIKIIAALERHLLAVKSALQNGKTLIDETDGCSHICKIASNSMILYTAINGDKHIK